MFFIIPFVFSKECENIPPIILQKEAYLPIYNGTLTNFRTTSFEKSKEFNLFITINSTADIYIKTNGKCPNLHKLPDYTAKPNMQVQIRVKQNKKTIPVIGVFADVNTTAHIKLPEFDHSSKPKSPSLLRNLILLISITTLVFQISRLYSK